MSDISVVFKSSEHTPVFLHYSNQTEAQPAYITLDLNNGNVDATASGEIGNGMPAEVWRGVIRRYPLRSDLTLEQVNDCINDVADTLRTIYAGSSVEHDGSNWVGRLNEDAESAEESLPELIGSDMESLVITNLTEWLTESGEDGWLPSENDSIQSFVAEVEATIDSEGLVTGENVKNCLVDLWADRFEENGNIPVNVAKTLFDDGRFEDSAWEEELNEAAQVDKHMP